MLTVMLVITLHLALRVQTKASRLLLGSKSDLRSVAVREMEKMYDGGQSLSARGMHAVLLYARLTNYPLFICKVPDRGLTSELCGKRRLKNCVCIKVKASRERPL